jgi:hypothetical protein
VDARDVERAAGDLGVGQDPGQTFAPFAAQGPAPPPAPMAAAAPEGALDAGDPLAPDDSGIDPFGAFGDPGASSSADLGPALELGEPVQTVQPVQEELTSVLPGAPEPEDAGTFDLDAEMNAILEERDDDDDAELPVFEAENEARPAMAEATRIAFGDEPEAAPADGDVAELDDLFVELIEE